MAQPIRVGIVGYGNLGRGVHAALGKHTDMALVGVFSRRDKASLELFDAAADVYPYADITNFKDRIDVLILCGGSRSDLPEQGPALAAHFNTVDSFDTHAKIPEYDAAVDAVAKPAGTTALISLRWDRGMVSLKDRKSTRLNSSHVAI